MPKGCGGQGSIRRKPAAERCCDTHTSIVVQVALEVWEAQTWCHDGEFLPAVSLEPREIEDAKVHDNERLDVDIAPSRDTETPKKRRITFKERPTHEDEDDFGLGTRAQSSGELGVNRSRESEEPCQMEVVLPQMRIFWEEESGSSGGASDQASAVQRRGDGHWEDRGRVVDDGYQLITNGSSLS